MKYEISDVINAKLHRENGFENLYKSINRDLFKMAFYILGNREIANDIVSETVLDAYYGIEKLKSTDKFESWISKILTTKCKRKMREKYEKITIFNPNVSDIDEISEKIGIQNDKEEVADVQMALDKLGDTERIIVTLCVIEGYKSHEVAEILSINASTVRSKLNRSLSKMRKYLEV